LPYYSVIGGWVFKYLAGFVTGWLRYRDVVRALQLGVACGSATAFSEGLATAKDIAAAQMILPVVQGI